jgi:hypothetical protein
MGGKIVAGVNSDEELEKKANEFMEQQKKKYGEIDPPFFS